MRPCAITERLGHRRRETGNESAPDGSSPSKASRASARPPSSSRQGRHAGRRGREVVDDARARRHAAGAKRSASSCCASRRAGAGRGRAAADVRRARRAHRQPPPAGAGAGEWIALRPLHRCHLCLPGGGRGVADADIEPLAVLASGGLATGSDDPARRAGRDGAARARARRGRPTGSRPRRSRSSSACGRATSRSRRPPRAESP